MYVMYLSYILSYDWVVNYVIILVFYGLKNNKITSPKNVDFSEFWLGKIMKNKSKLFYIIF